MRSIGRWFGSLAGVLTVVAANSVAAQPVGAFRWQQEPYCNVVTLHVVSAGTVFHLDGIDDQCGAATSAAVSGLAFLNPNGTVGLGLTIVTTPGGVPTHLDATVSLSTVSGTWRDAAGNNGPWTLQPGPSSGGFPRPALRPVFTEGLSAGGARIESVGLPTAATDAASKGYVDTSGAATRAYANALAVSSVPLTAYSAAVSSGSAPADQWGCRMLSSNARLRLDLPAPVGANIIGIQVKYLIFNTDALMTFQVIRVAFGPGGAGEYLEDAFNGSIADKPLQLRTLNLEPVSSTRTYYLDLHVPTHMGDMLFCGAEVLFTRP